MAVYRAKEPFAYTDKRGVPRSVVPGDLISDSDPNFKGKEHLYEPVEAAAARTTAMEDASAEPGALRARTRPHRGRRGPEPAPEAPAETTLVTDQPAATEKD